MGSLAERVTLLRELAGIESCRQVALRLNLNEGLVAKIERGERTQIHTATAMALARFFGVSFEWLVNGEGRAPSERTVRAAVRRFASSSNLRAQSR